MNNSWNERYGQNNFYFGEEPNEFIKEQLPLLKPGKILFPAEGEGRNAVFAAQLGWKVSAFDFSKKGKEKAESLALKKSVTIDYQIYSFLNEKYKEKEFDAIVMCYVHFLDSIKFSMIERLNNYLKIGGHIIMEVFSKDHREINKKNKAVGGPKDRNMMYTVDEIKMLFSNYEIYYLSKEIINLSEGYGHIGMGSVIRFIGKKIK